MKNNWVFNKRRYLQLDLCACLLAKDRKENYDVKSKCCHLFGRMGCAAVREGVFLSPTVSGRQSCTIWVYIS